VKRSLSKALLGLLLFCPPLLAGDPPLPVPRSLGVITVNRPAFLALLPFSPGGELGLVISSFRVFGKDTVRTVPRIGEVLGELDTIESVLLSDSVVWPNEVTRTPEGVFDFGSLTVAGGFLVPGKGRGAVSLLPLRSDAPFWAHAPVKLTADRPGWFYHRAMWRDMDGDGGLDVVTARGRKSAFGGAKGRLVWLRQPPGLEGVSSLARHRLEADAPWQENVLLEGPDVHFRLHDLDDDGIEEILAAEFFGRRLTLSWFQAREGALADRELETRVIDDGLGAAFDLGVVDLDGDGRRDLLVTNHEPDARAAVFAYDVPDDLRQGQWRRHPLLDGIETRQGGMNQASPGQAIAFQPRPGATEGRPWILVAGDGSQRAHLLIPEAEAPGTWGYREEILVDAGATVGQCLAADVDGDGYSEVFVPAWNHDKLHVFTFAPAAGS
jgi:hypothetical protein